MPVDTWVQQPGAAQPLFKVVITGLNNNNNNDRLTAFDPGQPG